MLAILIILLYILGALLTYALYLKDQTRFVTIEKIWYSIFWIVIPILAGIHWLHMHL